MRITALGETRDWPGGLTLQGWLDLAGVENQEIALNQLKALTLGTGWDVPRGYRGTTALREGDRLTLLYFLGDS